MVVEQQLFWAQIAAVALSAIFMALGVALFLRRRRGGGFADAESEPNASSSERSRGRRIGAMLRLRDDLASKELKDRLVRAGLYGPDGAGLYGSVRLIAPVAGLTAALLVQTQVEGPLRPLLLALLAIGALIGPSIWLDWRGKARHQEILRLLPSTIDMLVTCLDAGLNLEQALQRLVSQTDYRRDNVLADELRLTVDEQRAGLSLGVAFRRMSERIGHKDVHNLVALIVQASTRGANVSDALRTHSKALRRHRILALEEKAGKANAKLTLPLTLCLIPSMMLLLVGPAALQLLKVMSRM